MAGKGMLSSYGLADRENGMLGVGEGVLSAVGTAMNSYRKSRMRAS